MNSTSPNSNVISATPFLKQSITAADWNTASTWDPSGVPTGTEDILVKHAVTLSGAPEGVSNNVTINSGASVTINSGGALTVNGTLSNANTSGIVIKNGGSLKYASGTPSGTAERSVSNGTYHYLSSPVTSTTFNSVFPINQDKIWAQTYKESDGTWNNQTYATTLTPGVGYSIWVDATLSPQTANFSGVFNNDGVQFTLSKVNPGNDANLVGWNFLGNPYTAAIDWDNGGWHGGAGINGSVYTWNGSNYISWSGSTGSLTGGVIPAQNGFFVKTTVNGTVMTIPWSARVHSSQSLYKDAPANTLHLNIAGNNYKDDTYVQFVPGTTSGFDSQGDAYKLPGINEAPQLYSIIPGDVLSINALPSIPTNNEVSLGMKVGANTTYTITADGMETFDNSVPIYMDDLKLGVSTYLRNTPVYTFTAAPGDDENRFRLRFHYPTGVNEQQEAVNIFVYAAHGEIVLNNAGNYDGKFYVYSTTGQLLATGQMQGGKQTISSMPAGMYIVKAVTGNTIVSRKVILY
ncbi:MAG: T9SS type A sorting domain-containing protein [Bacteroidetes bacterium]|nr:T9SS type A sorting domain-containing protein [Bacteroidota bacterium]